MIQIKRLMYLHGILLPIDGVFGARPSIVAPVQVELHSLVAAWQASTWDGAEVRNSNLNWSGHTEHKDFMQQLQSIDGRLMFNGKCAYPSGRCSWLCLWRSAGSYRTGKESVARLSKSSWWWCWWATGIFLHSRCWRGSTFLALKQEKHPSQTS